MTLLLVRHGESEGNRDRIVQGWYDSPLTELGREQADLAAHGAEEAGPPPGAGVRFTARERCVRAHSGCSRWATPTRPRRAPADNVVP